MYEGVGPGGLKAQQAHSPGQRPGLFDAESNAPCKGKSINNGSCCPYRAFGFTLRFTQGVLAKASGRAERP